MKISNEILDILNQSRIEGNLLYLPDIKLDRSTYVSVNKVLESIGGKWSRKLKAHEFSTDIEEILEDIINTGEYTDKKKEYQYFPTPTELAEKLVDMADIKPEDDVLEPSAGIGNIVDVIKVKSSNISVCELMGENRKVLKDKGYNVIAEDFLELKDIRFSKIIANPPFCKQQDIDHILHMYELLKPGGTLVTICSESPFFRENKKSVEFRQFLEDVNAEVIELDNGAFKESGTMVKTRIIKIVK